MAMAWQKVIQHACESTVPNRQFQLHYVLEGESTTHQLVATFEQFLALAHLLRNEAPISYNTEGKYFLSMAQPPGASP